MRRLLVPFALFLLLVVSACSGSSPDVDTIKPGTSVTVTMKDGTVVAGRFVEARPEQIVVDPFEGGEWQTLARAQVASITQTGATNSADQGVAAGQPQPANPTPDTFAGTEPRRDTSTAKRPNRTPAPAPGSSLRGSESPAPASPRPEFEEVTIPAETVLHLKLGNALASDASHVEDPVRASLARAVVVDGREAVPAGSEVTGVVTDAKPSGKVKGRAMLAFRFDTVGAYGDEYKVRTQGVAREAESTQKKDAAKIGIPAAGGAIIGGILGGGKGAAIGGAVGGGAGTAVVLGTAGNEVRLPAGTAVTVKLLEPLRVRVPLGR